MIGIEEPTLNYLRIELPHFVGSHESEKFWKQICRGLRLSAKLWRSGALQGMTTSGNPGARSLTPRGGFLPLGNCHKKDETPQKRSISTSFFGGFSLNIYFQGDQTYLILRIEYLDDCAQNVAFSDISMRSLRH